MKMHLSRKAKWCLLAAAVSGLPVALAFNLGGGRWVNRETTMHIGMPGVSSSGVRWADALRSGMQQWTDQTDFTFVASDQYLNPCAGYSRSSFEFPSGGGDGRNGADFRNDVCGNAFGPNVLAITLSLIAPSGLISQSDIVFNGNLAWDIYDGPRRGSVDFARVALHELGHVLGLNHESSAQAIMAPTIGNIDALQIDDITGANVIYGPPVDCSVAELSTNAFVRDSLQQPDCRMMHLFGGGSDTSFVDVYRLNLAQPTRLRIAMQSAQVDSVLVLTDLNLQSIALEDDFQGSCDARMDVTLGAGQYLLLANTYDQPRKCVGNVGPYTISITDTALPQLGQPANTAGGQVANALFSGGASSDGGLNFKQQFTATESINIDAQIAVDLAHVGSPGKVYVLAILGNGQQYAQNSQGDFVPFSGSLDTLPARRAGGLQAVEKIHVISGLQGRSSGLAGQSFQVYVGYALDSRPQEIHFGNNPISFAIAP